MKKFTFNCRGICAPGIKFNVGGELHLEDHENAADEAAKCVRDSLGQNIQFTKIVCRPVAEKKGKA